MKTEKNSTLTLDTREILIYENGHPVYPQGYIYTRDGIYKRTWTPQQVKTFMAEHELRCWGTTDEAGIPVETYYTNTVLALEPKPVPEVKKKRGRPRKEPKS